MIHAATLVVLALAGPPSGAELPATALMAVPLADVVVLGEVHDNPDHHIRQAEAIETLEPRALVFEMLTPDQAAAATPALRSDPDLLGEALDWDGSGWPDFDMYYPVFAAAPGARIYGGGLPRERLRQAMAGDPMDAFGPEAARYGLDEDLPEEQQAAREALQMAAHCDALPEDKLPMMVMAQRLRDAALARAVVAAHAETGGPVVLITGNGHARTDWGVPAILSGAAPGLRVISVAQFEAPPDDTVPYDVWSVSPPVERDDPCAAFR